MGKHVARLILAAAILLAIASSASLALADGGNGQASPGIRRTTGAIVVGSGWQQFSWNVSGQPYNTEGAFTFTTNSETLLRVTDVFCVGDQFKVYDFGVPIGTTSAPGGVVCSGPNVTQNPDYAYGYPYYGYSRSAFSLAPGAHSITIQTIVNPLNTGVGFLRVDAVSVAKPASVSNGAWQRRYSLTSGPPQDNFTFGAATDVPLLCDWDGNRSKTPGVFRDGVWYLSNSSTDGSTDITLFFGQAGDIPICGDWDGNGTETVGVVRGTGWYLRNANTSGPATTFFTYGALGDRPIVGDWDGNGSDTPGVYRGGTWYLRNSNSGGSANIVFSFGVGLAGVLVAGDWNGDGKDEVGLVRGNLWLLRNSLTSGNFDTAFQFGEPAGKPLVWR